MIDDSIDNYCIGESTSVRDCMQIIDKNKQGFALILNEEGLLKGTITDGDIRRFILAGHSIDEGVSKVMWTNPLTLPSGTADKEIRDFMKKNLIRNIPIVDVKGRPLKVFNINYFLSEDDDHVKTAVIMAGGEGKRLKPITDDIPKPMIRVGGKPVLESIINQLADSDIKKIYISLNYKSEIIEKYFKDGAQFGVNISYLREKTKLGTAGALTLIPEIPSGPIIVINADVITKINYSRIIEFHRQHHCVMTVAATQYMLNIPYGVFNLSSNFLLGIEEKPQKTFFCNAGIYVLNPEIIHLISENEEFNMTDLIEKLIRKGLPITAFPLHEYWIDIGQMEDLKRAQNDLMENNE